MPLSPGWIFSRWPHKPTSLREGGASATPQYFPGKGKEKSSGLAEPPPSRKMEFGSSYGKRAGERGSSHLSLTRPILETFPASCLGKRAPVSKLTSTRDPDSVWAALRATGLPFSMTVMPDNCLPGASAWRRLR